MYSHETSEWVDEIKAIAKEGDIVKVTAEFKLGTLEQVFTFTSGKVRFTSESWTSHGRHAVVSDLR